MFTNPFARKTPAPTNVQVLDQRQMALDTVAAILRTLGEFALEQPQLPTGSFVRLCEQWAQHVLIAAPPPGDGSRSEPVEDTRGIVLAQPGAEARRDWSSVRSFVRDYCQQATGHARTVMTDLRQVVWVFIQSLSQSISAEQQADARVQTQLQRLEQLALEAPSGELKREALSTVSEISRVLDERRRAQKVQLEDLGAQVRTLGAELDNARRESETDKLTSLYNRRAFDDYIARSVELARAFGQPTCLLLVDIDRFKTINDTFGHGIGDDVLRKVSDTLVRTFLRKNDFVARLGGDELAVVLRDTAMKEAIALGDRLLKAVRAVAVEREGVKVQVTVSIGVAGLDAIDSAERWLETADRALYAAKRGGRDRVATASNG